MKVSVSWLEDDEPKERIFDVEGDSWHSKVRKAELEALARCDDEDDVTVFQIEDGETVGFYLWNGSGYELSELG